MAGKYFIQNWENGENLLTTRNIGKDAELENQWF